MANNNFFDNNPFLDAFKSFNDKTLEAFSNNPLSNAKAPTIDFKAISEIQRRNTEALTEATQLLNESVQVAARRYVESAQANMGEVLKATKEIIAAKSPEEGASQNNELAKSLFESSLSNASELMEVMSKSSMEAVDILNKRASKAIAEASELSEQVANTNKKKKAASAA